MTHTPGPWERSSEPSDTGSSKEMELEPEHYMCCSTNLNPPLPHPHLDGNICAQSKKISNDQELIQSDPTSCPQNQKGNN